ncbi:MAG TPA: hypothetical protein VK074_10345, partial [Fodinibius sp.]|nr:hypothetical protein [Fodinibius sp.]
SLERGPEMMLGVGGPVLMLLGYELWARYREKNSEQYIAYREQETRGVEEKLNDSAGDTSEQQNRYGLKVIAYSLAFTGGLILVLSFIASKAHVLVGTVGSVILGVAYLVWRYARAQPDNQMITEKTS